MDSSVDQQGALTMSREGDKRPGGEHAMADGCAAAEATTATEDGSGAVATIALCAMTRGVEASMENSVR